MTWWKSLVVITVCLCVLVAVVATMFTGRDIPINLSILLSTILGLALAGDGVIDSFIEKRRK